MKSDLKTLNGIFERRALRIPSYQRGYAWERQHRDDLLQDLEDLAQQSDGRHYTGTIVLREKESKLVGTDKVLLLDVVDGQQRLTTLVILLSCISDRLHEIAPQAGDEEARKVVDKEAGKLKEHFVSDRGLLKLELRGEGDAFFRNHIIGSEPVPSPSSRAARNLLEAKNQLRDYVCRQGDYATRYRSGESECKDLLALATRVKEGLYFVYFEVDSDADVGMMFEAMNARGKALTQFEKVKNYLLYVAGKVAEGTVLDSLVRSINESWIEVFRRLEQAGDRASEDAFLRFDWVSYPAAVPSKDGIAKTYDIHAALKSTIRVKEKSPQERLDLVTDYLSRLGPGVRAYASLISPNDKEAFSNLGRERESVVDVAARFSRLDRMASTMPLLMAVVVRFAASAPRAVLEMIRLAEVFAFRMMLLERRSNAGLTSAYWLARKVGAGKDPEETIKEMKDLIREYAPDAEVVASLNASDGSLADGNFYEWSGLRYFLFEYERYRVEERGQKFAIDWSKLCSRALEDTVEHILPQGENTREIEYWATRFSDEEFRRNRHRLGNLTLTQWNSSLQNKPFPNKCGLDVSDANASVYRNSMYVCERELIEYADWSPAEIEDRQRKLAEFAVKRWAI